MALKVLFQAVDRGKFVCTKLTGKYLSGCSCFLLEACFSTYSILIAYIFYVILGSFRIVTILVVARQPFNAGALELEL